MTAQLAVVQNPAIRLDFGCGKNKRAGFLGVDVRAFEGVDTVLNVVAKRVFDAGAVNSDGSDASHVGFVPWPWETSSIEEANASHFVEHLTAPERIHFVNELWRILVPNGKATIITPHWCSTRAYGDLTHQWPPVAEMWFYYLKREWRDGNAPHNDFYTCDFEATWGYSLRGDLMVRNQEYQAFAMGNYKEVCQDIICTLTALKP